MIHLLNESMYFLLVWKWGILHPVLWSFPCNQPPGRRRTDFGRVWFGWRHFWHFHLGDFRWRSLSRKMTWNLRKKWGWNLTPGAETWLPLEESRRDASRDDGMIFCLIKHDMLLLKRSHSPEISGPSPLKLTASPWKLMVGRRSFPSWRRPTFRGKLLVSESTKYQPFWVPKRRDYRSTGFQEWWDECFNENDMSLKRSHSRRVEGWKVWGWDDIFFGVKGWKGKLVRLKRIWTLQGYQI